MVWLLFLTCAMLGRKLLLELELNWKLLELVGLAVES